MSLSLSRSAPPIIVAPRDWLHAATRGHATALRTSGLLLTGDVIGAIGFAAGLALAIANMPQGLTSAAPWLLLMVASAMSRAAIAIASAEVSARAAHELKSTARRGALAAIFAQPASARRTTGAAMAIVVEGVEALDGYIARFLPAKAASTVAPLLIIVAVGVASPVCAGILAITMVPFVVGMALAGMAAADDARRQFAAMARLSSLFLDKVRALPLILAFQAEATQTESLARSADDLQRRTARVLRTAFLSSGVLEFFAALSVALVAVYCGFNLLRLLSFPVPETLTLPRAFFALALAPEVYAPLRRLAAAYHDRQAAEAAAPALAAPVPRESARVAIRCNVAPAIRFCRVAIRYPDAEAPVFDGFDLDLASGSITAVMGPSGSGKSSLLNLLLGLAPLSAGDAWLGDHRLSEMGAFAPLIAFAGQAPLIVPGTMAENIALARRDATPAEIHEVATRVGLTAALSARGDGIGARLDERGSGLSGGERRRIGLARAMLKPSRVLLLDEPTADLDSEAATALLPAIAAAAQGRTTLIATHSEALAGLAHRVVRL
jgi:ATP-binding cassette subfamily C protein CydD